MRRVIIAIDIRKYIIIFLTVCCFIIFLPILLMGIDSKKALNNDRLDQKFVVKSNDIVFDKSYGVGPIIKVYITKEKKLKEMYLEEYVSGVVAGEMPASFESEALKSQAIAARTYAAAHMMELGSVPCSQANGGDICDTVHCQVFMSKEDRMNNWEKDKSGLYWNKITEAVKATSGEILIFNREVAKDIKYFSISSGKTENSSEVFSSNSPYLKSVTSPGEEIAPKYKTTVNISISELVDKINKNYPKAGITASKVKSQLTIIDYNEGGSVRTLKIGNSSISGTQFRTLFELNSANFAIKFLSSAVEITCLGYGHGVGMSQWGANVMAKSGKVYKEILTHYYQGVRIMNLSEIKR